MNVVGDLVAQIVLHFHFNSLFIERIDRVRIHAVSAQKIAMALMKLPE